MLDKETKIFNWFIGCYCVVIIGMLTILILHGFKVF